jgi:signal recognition particle receptor subunit beta
MPAPTTTVIDDAAMAAASAASSAANAASTVDIQRVPLYGPFDGLGEALGVDPFMLMLVASAAVGFLLLLVVLGLSSSSTGRRVRGKTMLLLGHMKAGKTVLLNQLCYAECPDTVTSMKVTEKRTPVEGVERDTVRLVDVPGHPRTRGEWRAFSDDTAGIVFLVDSVHPSVRNAAEYLAEILTDRTVDALQPPILVACNKADVKGAKTPDEIQAMLEAELDQLKETRSSLESTADDGSEALMLGMAGKAFRFDVDSPCEVTFCACSAKRGGAALRPVRNFIASSLSHL